MEFGVGKYRMQVAKDKIWTQNNGVRNKECGVSRKQWEKRLEYYRRRGNEHLERPWIHVINLMT